MTEAAKNTPGTQEFRDPNVDWKCPNCGELNSRYARICDCGFDIAAGIVRPAPRKKTGPEKRRFYGTQFLYGLGLLLVGVFLSAFWTWGDGILTIWIVPVFCGAIWLTVGLVGWLAHLRAKS